MDLLKFLFRNKTDKDTPWEETTKGKEFAEKVRLEAEERARKNEEWERTVPPERKAQYKLFKIFFTIFFLLFVALLIYGFYSKLALIFLGCEFIFAGISLIFFFIKPKFVKYPNCFMMPVIAFGCSALFFVFLGFQYGFSSSFDKNMFCKNKIKDGAKVEINLENSDKEKMFFEDEKDFNDSEYTKFLRENNLENSEELKNDYMEYRRDNVR